MNFLSTLSSALLGYLHFARAFLNCCISLLKSSGLVQTVLALWVRVLKLFHIVSHLLCCPYIYTYLLFQGWFYKQIKGACMGSPIMTLVVKLLWRTLKPRPSGHHPIPQDCGGGMWLIPLSFRKQHTKTSSWNTSSPSTPVSSETRQGGSMPFLAHPSHTRTRQNPLYNSIQKTYPHWAVSTVGQPP